MAYWLMKSEPDEFSIQDLKERRTAPWDGVRNYQARNFIRQMQPGDEVFFYHSSCKSAGITGVMAVSSLPYPDPLAQDKTSPYYDEKSKKESRWSAIDVSFKQEFAEILGLKAIQKLAETDQHLKDLPLIAKGNRLSVIPITNAQWQCLMAAIKSK